MEGMPGWTRLTSGESCLCHQCGSRVTETTAEILVREVAAGVLVYRAVCNRCQHPLRVIDGKRKAQ